MAGPASACRRDRLAKGAGLVQIPARLSRRPRVSMREDKMEYENETKSTTEIVITPAMIEAGCDALWDSDYGHPTSRSIDVMVSILFEALKAGGFSPKMSSDHLLEC
jgi:hypothetical protein